MYPLAALGTGLCPIPSAYLTFRTLSGTSQVMATAWVGVVCSRPAILSVTLRHPSGISEQWPEGGEFAVNLPSEEQMASRPVLPPLAGSGLTLEPGVKIAAPLISECPVRLECRSASFFNRHGQKLLSGEIVAVHMGKQIHGLDGPVDLCRLQPLSLLFDEGRKTGFEGIVPPGVEAGFLGGAPS